MFQRPSARDASRRRLCLWIALLATFLLPAHAQIVFNEAVSRNLTGILDEDGDRPDWIELHNPGASPVALKGWALSDDPQLPRKWVFRSGQVPARGFQVVFLSGKDRQIPGTPLRPGGAYHASFRLSADGETLHLSTPAETILEVLEVPALPPDVAWGRKPDGSGPWVLFALPTPGASNRTASGDLRLAAPEFSRPAGFATNAFPLTLTSSDAGAEIRYTLDGSPPTESSLRYTAPLAITNRTPVRNRLSVIPTVPGGLGPVGNIFKGTVVRARAFRTNALSSEIATATYFVHPRGESRYSLPVVSLSTDERNFFDPDIGIYVPGNAPGGNYAQAGDAWERPVHVEFFETDGSRPISQPAGVRIHGNTSFFFPLKALRLHPLNQGGTGPFRHRIFPDHAIDSFDRLLLRPSGHDYNRTLMRDGLQQGLVRELGLDLQAYRPAIVFLNGEYWGIHNLQEAFEKRYFSHHHPEVDANAIDYLEGYPPGCFAYEGDSRVIDELFTAIPTLPIESTAGWDWIRTRMDVDNFRDYKLAEIFDYRWDIGNHRLWRSHTGDTRLRWIYFDCDVGFGGFWSEPDPWRFNMLEAVLEPTGSLNGHNTPTTVLLLRRLLANDGFRVNFISRAADLLNTTFATPRVVGFIDRMSAEIAPEIAEHAIRWRAPGSFNDWTHEVEALRTFARERPAHFRAHLLSRFRLKGLVTLTLDNSAPGAGELRVNSLPNPAGPSGTWSGTYFRGVPIRLEATPRPGWRFAEWTGLPGATNAAVTVTLQESFSAIPRFAPLVQLRWARTGAGPDAALRLDLVGPPAAEVSLEQSSDLRLWREFTRTRLDASGNATTDVPDTAAAAYFRLRLVP